MRNLLEMLLLLLSMVALGMTVRGLLAGPYRDARIAVASGVTVTIGFGLGKRLAFDPSTWTTPTNSAIMRLSTLLLSTLTLVLVGAAYQALRRRARRPMLIGLLFAVPAVAIIAAIRGGGEAIAHGVDAAVLTDLSYDALLAAGAFILPMLTFELMWRSSAWREMPAQPRLDVPGAVDTGPAQPAP